MKRYYKLKDISSSDKVDDFPSDPAKRKNILDYHPNQRVKVRCKYLAKGLCQPYGINFKKTLIGGKMTWFNPAWFYQYGSWLEYSVSEKKNYCLCCYLFRDDWHPGFVRKGFSSLNKLERLFFHVGEPNSSQFCQYCCKKCDDLMNQGQSIIHALYKKDDSVKNAYRIRLQASTDVSRHLLRQRLFYVFMTSQKSQLVEEIF